MWRALFLAVGLTFVVLGLQCLAVEQLVVKNIRGGSSSTDSQADFQNPAFQNASYQTSLLASQPPKPKYKVFKTKDWMPWSLLAVGAVVVIYTFSLPGRSSRNSEDE